jgi:hypothetical protein
VKALLSLRADPNAKASDQLLAIHQACQNQNLAIMDILFKAGCDLWTEGGIVIEELEELAKQFHNTEIQVWVETRKYERANGLQGGTSNDPMKEKELAAISRLQERKEREPRLQAGLISQSQLKQEQQAVVNARLAGANMSPNVSDNYYAWKSKGGPTVLPRTALEILRKANFMEWSSEDVILWFAEIHLSDSYAELVRTKQLNGKRLSLFHSVEDWRQIGIWKLGDCRKLLKATGQSPFDGSHAEYSQL